MRGLETIPSERHLLKAYESLYSGNFDCKDLALWARWTRFDPRLGEIWVSEIAKTWQRISPLDLASTNKELVWPQCIGVLLDTIEIMLAKKGNADFKRYQKWMALVLHEIPKAANEQYFIGLAKFAGKIMKTDAALTIDLYRRWGFIGCEIMINKFRPEKTRLTPLQRRWALNELLKIKKRITADDYRRAAKYWISRRQAERDLANHKKLKAHNQTRGRYYLYAAGRKCGRPAG